jgi:anti-sigma factor RsiW
LNRATRPGTKGREKHQVKCNEVSEKLLDAAEGALATQDRLVVDAHLAQCAACRAELAQLTEGLRGLQEHMPVLAPREHYLTRARLDRVMGSDGPRIFRLATYRQFVGAAAAAAIIISAAFIAAHILGVRDALRLQDAPAVAMQAEPPVHYVPVMVAAPGQGQPINVAHAAQAAAEPVPRMGSVAASALRMDTPGVTVPVNHAFYDPEESSHWW